MPGRFVTNGTIRSLFSRGWLLAVLGAAACLQLDAPMPAGPMVESSEAPRPPAALVSSPPEAPHATRADRGAEPPESTASPALAEGQPSKGVAVFEQADAEMPPGTQGGIDSGTLAPPETELPPYDFSPNDGSTLQSLCPPGSIVFVEGVRYVCGSNGVAYDLGLVWLLSS